MLNKILPVLIVAIAIGGAGFAAMTLKQGQTPEVIGQPDHEYDDVHDVEDTVSRSLGYFDFRRNFLIPVVRHNSVRSVVLLTLSIEMEETSIEEARSREPRIRDAFMKTLLELSHEGVFDTDITDPAVYETVQQRLHTIAKQTVHESAEQVLIIDFGRQEQ